MTDRYERIRAALAMGPTPGPWRPSKSYGAIVSDSPSGHDDAESVHAYGGHMVCESVQEHNRHLIAACDPDTIRELLAERDQLAAEIEALRAEDDAWCAECGVKLENVRPGKHQHPICSQAQPLTDEALLRQALEALELRCGTNADERKELIPVLRERLGEDVRKMFGGGDD